CIARRTRLQQQQVGEVQEQGSLRLAEGLRTDRVAETGRDVRADRLKRLDGSAIRLNGCFVLALTFEQTSLLPFPAIKRLGKLRLLSGKNSLPGQSQSGFRLTVLLVKLGEITLRKGFNRVILYLGR